MTSALLETNDVAALPAHLVAQDGQPWGFWRWAVLRGTGFPTEWIARLATPQAARAADALREAEAAQAEAIAELTGALRRAIDVAGDDKPLRNALRKALDRVHRGRLSDAPPAGLETEFQRALAAAARTDAARRVYEATFDAGTSAVSEAIAAIARDDRFRRAVLLQNRAALNTILPSFDAPRSRTSKHRQHEELIASYVQRYCVKNDSIGFFGPVGWVEFDPSKDALDARPGPDLIDKSDLYFEYWAIEALGETIAADPAARESIPPRRRPAFRIEGNRLHHARGSDELPPLVAAVLEACDGQQTPRQIAARFRAALGGRENAIVLEVLRQLAQREVISWTFWLPYEQHPERRLRAQFERIENEPLRTRALASLDELEAARARVFAALGDAAALDAALGNLDETFVRLTGRAVNRNAGQMYAGRTLVYLDCRRDMQMEIGADVFEALATPMSLLITGIRWLTARAAELYRAEFARIFGELAGTRDSIPVQQFWEAADGVLFAERRAKHEIPMFRALDEFQQRWESILAIPDDAHAVHYSSAALRARVEETFAAPAPGWQMARYHSPDVMICADSVESIRSGDYTLVLGEVHSAYNSARPFFAASQHPDPAAMQQAIDDDLAEPQIWFLQPRKGGEATVRTGGAMFSPKDYYLEIFDESIVWAPPRPILRVADFAVARTPRGLVVRSVDGRMEFDALEFFGVVLTRHALNSVKLLGKRTHAPRITIDRLALSRETWSFPAAELDFARAERECDRFAGARRWAREHGLPRMTFFRVHVERKPLYLDFESPIYVETFCKCIRRVLASDRPDERVTVSEMLPTPDQVWLSDAAGEKYASEFRTVVVDMAGR